MVRRIICVRLFLAILIAHGAIIVFLNGAAHSQESLKKFVRGFRLVPAIGGRVNTVDVKRKSDGQEAELTDDPGSIFISFSAAFPEYMFGESRWGFSYFVEFSTFKTDKQIADLGDGDFKPKDLGTSTSGTFLFIVPIIFYKVTNPELGALKLGGGIGYGQAKIKGNAILGPDRMVSRTDPKVPVSTEDNSTFAFVFFMEGELGEHWTVGVKLAKMIFDDSEFEYGVEDFTAFVSYLITFD